MANLSDMKIALRAGIGRFVGSNGGDIIFASKVEGLKEPLQVILDIHSGTKTDITTADITEMQKFPAALETFLTAKKFSVLSEMGAKGLHKEFDREIVPLLQPILVADLPERTGRALEKFWDEQQVRLYDMFALTQKIRDEPFASLNQQLELVIRTSSDIAGGPNVDIALQASLRDQAGRKFLLGISDVLGKAAGEIGVLANTSLKSFTTTAAADAHDVSLSFDRDVKPLLDQLAAITPVGQPVTARSVKRP